MVAGGGGGSGWPSPGNAIGGDAGGLYGYNGAYGGDAYVTLSQGGTQIRGGAQSVGNTSKYGAATPGGFGYAGNSNGSYAGGGGSGWYGGGGGATYDNVVNSGAGGSSYISGHEGCIGINGDGTLNASSATSIEDSYSYTGFIFKKTKMIDGSGYTWTTQVGSSVSKMPSPTSAVLITGNTGHGFARITFVK